MSDLDLEQARFNMVEQQVRTWDVLDQKVLDVINRVPREAFVPSQHRNQAFADLQIPLGHGQVMLEPKLEGRILQALAVQPSEQVLEIGAGSGYMAACFARMGAQVTSVDIYPELCEMAENNLKSQAIGNVSVIQGDAAQGWSDGRRYDAICVSAALPELHRGFHESLSIGGRLLLIVGEAPIQEALLITRVSDDQWASESLLETWVPMLVGAERHRAFAI